MFALACLLIAATPQGEIHKTTIVFGGDIMLNQIPVKIKPLQALKPFYATGDVGLANLEIPLTDAPAGTPYKTAKELKARTQFILKADPKHIESVRAAGIGLVSLGNNHAMDYRAAGLNQMLKSLTKSDIAYTGAGPTLSEAKEAVQKGPVVLVSALAFMNTGAINKLTPATDTSAGIHGLFFSGSIGKASKAYLKDWITGQIQDKKSIDRPIVVVALHWGIERQTVPTAYQVSLAHACIDAGADVVWGHHPHVLQGAELYKGKPILYSMGNLISKKEGPTGLIRLYFENAKFKKARFIPLTISGLKVKPVADKQVEARTSAFKKLCQSIIVKYPNKSSKALF